MISNGKKNTGISIAEYALIFALVAIVAIPTLSILGDAIASGLRDNEPTSRADALFALLGGSGANTGAGTEAVAGMGTSPPQGQPLSNVAFNYNPQTGMVEIILPDGSSGGSMTTSADGTRILAQNLADLASNPALPPQERQQLQNLSNLGFKIAAEEEKLLAKYPQLAEGENVDLNFFNPSMGLDTTLYFDYQDFTAAYEKLSAQLKSSEVEELKASVDTNAALISQLAYHNFVEMQMRPENGAASWRQGDAASKMVTADGTIAIETYQYEVAETPAVTEEASSELQDSGV